MHTKPMELNDKRSQSIRVYSGGRRFSFGDDFLIFFNTLLMGYHSMANTAMHIEPTTPRITPMVPVARPGPIYAMAHTGFITNKKTNKVITVNRMPSYPSIVNLCRLGKYTVSSAPRPPYSVIRRSHIPILLYFWKYV